MYIPYVIIYATIIEQEANEYLIHEKSNLSKKNNLPAAEPRPSQKMARRAVVPDFIFDS